MKLIKTVDAEGAVLCHDITQIIKGVTKDAVFRKGHIVTKRRYRYFKRRKRTSFMYGKRKRACFMKMTLQKSFVPCAKGTHGAFPGKRRKDRAFCSLRWFIKDQ